MCFSTCSKKIEEISIKGVKVHINLRRRTDMRTFALIDLKVGWEESERSGKTHTPDYAEIIDSVIDHVEGQEFETEKEIISTCCKTLMENLPLKRIKMTIFIPMHHIGVEGVSISTEIES